MADTFVPFTGRFVDFGTFKVFPSCEPGKEQSLLAINEIVRYTGTRLTHRVDLRYCRQQRCTKRFYHFRMPGGPSASVLPADIDNVCNRIETFADNAQDAAILLHCTHGLNRTLLVLAALWMRRRPGATVGEAVEFVRAIRPPGIQRPHIVAALNRWDETRKKDGTK